MRSLVAWQLMAALACLLLGARPLQAQAPDGPPPPAGDGAAGEPGPPPDGGADPSEGRPGEPPPEAGPPPDDGGNRSDLIQIRVAFDDRAGGQLRNGYALLKPDNDPATRKCTFVDDGAGDDEAKGDGVYMCAAAIQRTQLVSLQVFHKPAGKDILLVKAKIKLPSAPKASIAIKAPSNFEVGDFKVLDPFYFMEPDTTGQGPDGGGEAGDVMGVLGEGAEPQGEKASGPPEASSVTTSRAVERPEPSASGSGGRDVALWLVVAALGILQLLRIRVPSRLAAMNERLRGALETHDRPLLAELLPDLRPLALAMEGWVLAEGAQPLPIAPPPVAAPPSGDAPPGQLFAAPTAPVTWRGALQGMLHRETAGGLPLPATVHPHDPQAVMAGLHRRGLLPVALWDAFPLSADHPTALLREEGEASSPLVAAVCRELAGRLGLPTVVFTSRAGCEALEAQLTLGPAVQRPWPPPPWRPDLGDASLGPRGGGPPDVGDRLLLSGGDVRDLNAMRHWLQGLAARWGAVALVLDDAGGAGLADSLLAPEAAARELLDLLDELRAGVRAYALLVGGDRVTHAAARALADVAGPAGVLRIRPREEAGVLEVSEDAPGGRRAHVRLDAELGWAWAAWRSEPVAPVTDLARLAAAGEGG